VIRNYAADPAKDERYRDKTYVRVSRLVDFSDEGTLATAVAMPPETLALRAGEYGLDPADTALLLDVVLHEGFITYADEDHPLWTAPSIAAARERHLDEVATVRARHAALGKDWDRPRGYPTERDNRAALIRAAELSPIRRDTVLVGRRMARNTWAQRAATARRG
jgi:hypothetical protein